MSRSTYHKALERIQACIDDKSKTTLDLSDLQLESIPVSSDSKGLLHIKALDVSGNQISKIEGLEHLPNLSDLYLSGNQISKIEGLEHLPNLSELYLYGNQISKIEGLEHLPNLSKLYLSGNQISKIEGLEHLPNLSELYLYGNQISKIEEGLEHLPNLSELYLSGNQISKIEGLEHLPNLSELSLSRNQISKIEGLEHLPNLSELYLSENQISKIEGLEHLPNLSELDLSGNQISKIEGLSISQWVKIKNIDLSNNPITGTPIVDFKDVNAIVGYIKSLQQQEEKTDNQHLKINIIGAGRIGKSQLLNYFDGKPYVANEAETHGTRTAKYKIPGSAYEATIWDFGGQSYHHGFHYLFLRPGDFYVVLWRSVKEREPDYAYWLGTARYFAKDKKEDKYISPLLLVQNTWGSTDEKEDKNFVPDEAAYPSSNKLLKYQLALQDVFAIDVKQMFDKTGKSLSNQFFIELLHQKMIGHCKQIENLPKEFVDIKERLDKKPLADINIKKEKFKKDYANNFDEDRFAYLLQYLEFTGNIISFREIDALKNYVSPNPPALSDWIYQTVLNNHFKENNSGKLSREELEKKTGSKEKADIFIRLMNEFKLVFEQPFSEKNDDPKDKYYIIPQFLPAYNHSFKQVLLQLLPFTFSLQFSDFIHEGRFFKFISSYGQYAKDNSAYWKYGLLFTYELNMDAVNKTAEDKKKDSLQVIAYYVSEKRQVMFHIEDKKGKTEAARELFAFFASTETPDSMENEEIKSRRYAQKRMRQLAAELNLKSHKETEKVQIPLQDDIQLCTNGHNYFDVKETIKNIEANNFFGTCVVTQARIKLDFMAINLLSTDNKRKLRIFFSYSHKDEMYRYELEKHFTMLKRNGRIETWHDRKIVAGENWDDTIKQQLQSADIVLLMLSADFLYSDYIWEQELGIIRERYKKQDGIKAIPIFVRPCDTEGLEFMDLQGAQKDEQSQLPWVSSSSDRDKVYTGIVKEIKKAIDLMY